MPIYALVSVLVKFSALYLVSKVVMCDIIVILIYHVR